MLPSSVLARLCGLCVVGAERSRPVVQEKYVVIIIRLRGVVQEVLCWNRERWNSSSERANYQADRISINIWRGKEQEVPEGESNLDKCQHSAHLTVNTWFTYCGVVLRTAIVHLL